MTKMNGHDTLVLKCGDDAITLKLPEGAVSAKQRREVVNGYPIRVTKSEMDVYAEIDRARFDKIQQAMDANRVSFSVEMTTQAEAWERFFGPEGGEGTPELSEAEGEQGEYPDDTLPAVAWWVDDAREIAEATMPKAIEYGSIELVEAGRTLARLMGMDEVSDQAAMETQIYQYVMGKMGRWTAAMSRGDRVSDDTIFDILVYATMVRKIRQTGEWP